MKFAWFTAVVFLILSGCASVPQVSAQWKSGPAPKNSGVVIAQTTNNSQRISGEIESWKELVLWSDEGENSKTYSLHSLLDNRDIATYIGYLPAGKYRVGLLWTTNRHYEYSVSAKAYVPPTIGVFEVKPGHVTNLGVLVYHPFTAQGRRASMLSDYMITRFDKPSLWAEILSSNIKAAKYQDANMPVLGWLPDEHDELRQKGVALLQQYGHPMQAQRLVDSRLVVFGKFGRLAVTSNDNAQWQDVKTETSNTIYDVAKMENGHILAVGESGYLAEFTLEGELVEQHAWPDGRMDLKSAVVHGDTVLILAFTNGEFKLVKYSLEQKQMQPIGVVAEWKRYLYGPFLIKTATGADVYVDGSKNSYSVADGSASKQKSHKFSYLTRQPDGSLVGIREAVLTSVVTYSHDDGQTWQDTAAGEIPWGSRVPRVYRAANGSLYRPGKDVKYEFKLFSSQSAWNTADSVPLLASTDNGVTYQAISNLPQNCMWLEGAASTDQELLVMCDNGSIYVSEDGGKEWSTRFDRQLDRSNSVPAGLTVVYKRSEAEAEPKGDSSQSAEAKQ